MRQSLASNPLEAALAQYLSPASDPPASESHSLRQESNTQSLRRLERDLAIASELLATFMRYFLTITPPLPEAEHAAARALGQLRLDAVIQDVARRLRTDRSLMARVSAVLADSPSETDTDTSKPDSDNASSAAGPDPPGTSAADGRT